MMNNIAYSRFPYQNLQHFSVRPDILEMPKNYQNMASFVAELQGVVLKQQAIINALVNQVKMQEMNNGLTPSETEQMVAKMEPDQSSVSENANATSDDFSEAISEQLKQEEEDEEEESQTKRPVKIRRRNAFKIKTTVKVEEDDSSEISVKKGKSKKVVESQKVSNHSKAKHLWVNYGRRILDYALSETTGPMHERVKQLVGKLNSKKDFERAFLVNESDSSEEKMFKTLLGKLAIYFVKQKASPTFETSKYKNEMVNQRHIVAAWIERLIGD